MTGATLILCVWLVAPTPADVALVAMEWRAGLPAGAFWTPPPCEPSAIPMASYAECQRMLPVVLRRLREQYQAVNGGCNP